MFKFTVLVLVLAAVVVKGEPGDGKDKCMKVFLPHASKCCKSFEMEKAAFFAEIKECLPEHPPQGEKGDSPPNPPTGPPPCDVDICIGKKLEIIEGDGKTINTEALKALLEKNLPAEIIEAISKNCLAGDLEKYGPADMCDPMKIRHCIQFHVFKDCKEWDSSEKCSEVKSSIDECAKTFE